MHSLSLQSQRALRFAHHVGNSQLQLRSSLGSVSHLHVECSARGLAPAVPSQRNSRCWSSAAPRTAGRGCMCRSREEFRFAREAHMAQIVQSSLLNAKNFLRGSPPRDPAGAAPRTPPKSVYTLPDPADPGKKCMCARFYLSAKIFAGSAGECHGSV